MKSLSLESSSVFRSRSILTTSSYDQALFSRSPDCKPIRIRLTEFSWNREIATSPKTYGAWSRTARCYEYPIQYRYGMMGVFFREKMRWWYCSYRYRYQSGRAARNFLWVINPDRIAGVWWVIIRPSNCPDSSWTDISWTENKFTVFRIRIERNRYGVRRSLTTSTPFLPRIERTTAYLRACY